jgi:hypothetical protein
MQTCATMATTPSSTSSAVSPGVSATQVKGAAIAPNSSAPTVCVVTSTMSEVPRTSRVQIISTENEKLPAMATMAAGVSAPAVGPSAIMTPANPAITASQRRQPTCSPSSSGEIAVT